MITEIFPAEQKLLETCIRRTPNIINPGAIDAVASILRHKEFSKYENFMNEMWTNPGVLPVLDALENKIKTDVKEEVGIEIHSPDFSAAMKFIGIARELFPKG